MCDKVTGIAMSFSTSNPRLTVLGKYTAGRKVPLPLVAARISAGFPSGMDDFIERKLDLNELLIRHEAATYFIRVQGDSMTGAGIHDGDILIVDRAEEPRPGRIVIAVINGELTVKRIARRSKRLFLQAANDHYPEIEVTPETPFEIWGVVRYVIHSLE